MARQITSDDARRLFEQFAGMAVEIFNDKGEIEPQVFFVVMGDAPGEVADFGALHPKQVQMLMNGPASKNLISHFISQALEPDSFIRTQIQAAGAKLPDVVVQISEAWTSANLNAAIQPDREEVIAVFVHQHGRTDVGHCPILENPRRAELGELFSPSASLVITGRFSLNPNEDPTCH